MNIWNYKNFRDRSVEQLKLRAWARWVELGALFPVALEAGSVAVQRIRGREKVQCLYC